MQGKMLVCSENVSGLVIYRCPDAEGKLEEKPQNFSADKCPAQPKMGLGDLFHRLYMSFHPIIYYFASHLSGYFKIIFDFCGHF